MRVCLSWSERPSISATIFAWGLSIDICPSRAAVVHIGDMPTRSAIWVHVHFFFFLMPTIFSASLDLASFMAVLLVGVVRSRRAGRWGGGPGLGAGRGPGRSPAGGA